MGGDFLWREALGEREGRVGILSRRVLFFPLDTLAMLSLTLCVPHRAANEQDLLKEILRSALPPIIVPSRSIVRGN